MLINPNSFYDHGSYKRENNAVVVFIAVLSVVAFISLFIQVI